MLKNTLTILGLLFACSVFAQKLDYKQGELLVQFHPKLQNVDTYLNSKKQFQGRNTQIEKGKCLSESMNIWKVKFDFGKIHEEQFLNHIRKDKLVLNAQFNHLIELRNTPNDPEYSFQWQYFNDGINGNPEADLDADLAWDITTGGVTVNGDSIVVVALDDGVDLDHEDLRGNLWINHGEIPDNGIDDDGNGYIDDVNGWNPIQSNGNVGFGGGHGTPVMGIMGAKGNNGIGVTGVNWDVKIMMVKADFQADEATLIEGYGYPLALRKMYNETNGEKGAFIVATNASWGVDGGHPENAPIWCALYDSLGQVGILNCGATANENTNVDIDGDLPTTCPSDFLIGVTNVNRVGEKEFFAGYGKENIDLGAFGEDTYNVAQNNQYGNFGGTSAAAPHVTGAIGLLYSAPCNNLGTLIKESPAAAALYMRQLILDGVKPNQLIDTLVATGGQLNLNNSLRLLLNDCGPCPAPLLVKTTEILDESAQINWLKSEVETSATIRYRLMGTSNWTIINNAVSPLKLTNLIPCSNYEYQIKSDCGDETSGYTTTYSFKTDGCCIPPENVRITQSTTDKIRIEWDTLLAAQSYEINFNFLGSGNLQLFTTTESFIEFTNLPACTAYEFQVRTICKNQMTTEFSALQTFTTNGCGSCRDIMYCHSTSKLVDEWISKVTLNTLVNESGDDNGYGDFTGESTDLSTLETYELGITVGYGSLSFPENFQAWIDFNQDGDFEDEGENIINLEEDVLSEYIGKFTVPIDAHPGLTRLRVSIKWREGVGDTAIPGPCDEFDFGEVEDYCVNIIPTVAPCFVPKDFTLSKNPTTGALSSISWPQPIGALNYNYRYKKTGDADWTNGVLATISEIDLGLLNLESCQTYEFQTQSVCDSMMVSEFSETFEFSTACSCVPPVSIQQVDTSLNSLQVTWEAISEADKYEVTLRKVGQNGGIRINTVGNVANFTSLDKCSEYEISVRSFCLETIGEPSLIFNAITACDVAITSIPQDVERLTVFPNPVKDNLQLEAVLGAKSNIAISLFDASGKALINQNYSEVLKGAHQFNFSMGNYPSGIYLIALKTDSGSTVRRVVKL